MTRDLFSGIDDLEDESETESDFEPPILEANYVTRLVKLWIDGDPTLREQCMAAALARTRMRKSKKANPAPSRVILLADDLRRLVIPDALAVELKGIFYDLFTEGAREIQWSELAAFYFKVVAGSP